MKYLSLFSGIGGFELGIQQAYERRKPTFGDGYRASRLARSARTKEEKAEVAELLSDIKEGNSREPTCIGFSEIDKYATKIYESHFPEHKNYGDIKNINEKELPEFDLIVGGFPCQSFSIAGKRGGFNDTRGTMFFEIARILRAKQPRLLLLENVKGLLSHDEGRTFATIIATLDELGYDLQWQVLNSKNHGVPQNRERVFIVGHLRGTPRPQVFPIGETDGATNKGLKQGDTEVTSTLRSRYGNGTGSHIKIREATKKGYAEATVGQSINLAVPNSKTRRGRVSNIAQTIDTGMQQHTLTKDMQIRRLTPTECARLQGFPGDWHKVEGISDTQAYKCYGNAVTVNVIESIISKLLTLQEKLQ